MLRMSPLGVDHPVDEGEERFAQARSHGDALDHGPLEAPLELEQHVLLGREVEVEGRTRHARRARDAGDAGAVEAHAAELCDGRLEQARSGPVTGALPRSRLREQGGTHAGHPAPLF